MIVLIDPMLNPDGRNRFTQWVNANRGKVATSDLSDREHNEPWPGGRTNHYWFDMNRDLLPVALKETSHRLDLYHSWRPQLVTDHHEQGSKATFFFQPGIPSGNNPNTPLPTVALTKKIGEFHARELDRIGSLYFSEEVYDDFYYGKGSTYPDINGAVGILFEQASSRSLVTQGSDGEMDYAFTIRNQFATMISTLEAGLALRQELLRNQWEFYRSVDDFARKSPVRGYVFSMPEDRSIAEMFIGLLHKHRIKVYRLTSDLRKDGARFDSEDSWIVPLNQVQGKLVKTIFEEVTEFGDVVFYDVSAWTLPHAFDLQFRELDSLPDKMIGSEVVAGDLDRKGRIVGGEAAYAYVLKWNLWAAGAVYQLLDRGINARIINTGIEIDTGAGKVAFDGPSVIIPVMQKEIPAGEVHEAVKEIVGVFPVEVYPTGSGISVEGPYLGSSRARPLRKPEIALITGDGSSSREAGEAWYVLDEKMEIPVSLIDQDVFQRIELFSYNCLVLPSGAYRDWKEPEIEALKEWINKGGTLIAIRGAVKWAIKSGIIDEEMVEEEPVSLSLPYAELGKETRGRRISGAIFKTTVDNTHPLAFGIRQELPIFRNHTEKMKPSKKPGANLAVYANNPLISGYLPGDQKGKIDRTASIIARRSGSGSVILFLDNPVFRGHWWGTSRLFLNSVFFGNLF